MNIITAPQSINRGRATQVAIGANCVQLEFQLSAIVIVVTRKGEQVELRGGGTVFQGGDPYS